MWDWLADDFFWVANQSAPHYLRPHTSFHWAAVIIFPEACRPIHNEGVTRLFPENLFLSEQPCHGRLRCGGRWRMRVASLDPRCASKLANKRALGIWGASPFVSASSLPHSRPPTVRLEKTKCPIRETERSDSLVSRLVWIGHVFS